MLSQKPEEWVYEQYAAQYYTFKTLSAENMRFIEDMPGEIRFTEFGKTVAIRHNDGALLDIARRHNLTSGRLRNKLEERPENPRGFIARAEESMESDPGFSEYAASFGSDVMITGHSHIQWHACARGKTFINPGSAGSPLDFDTCAPYTVLDIGPDGISVTERRAAYEIEDVIARSTGSEMYEAAGFWMDLGFYAMRNAREIHSIFLRSLKKAAALCGSPNANEAWKKAVGEWRWDR